MAILYNSNYDITVPFSDVCFQLHLLANAALTVNIPGVVTDKYSARFEYADDSNVFVCLNAVPVIPAGGVVGTQQYCEFKPGDDDGSQRYLKGGDVLHLITPDAVAYVGISLRQLP